MRILASEQNPGLPGYLGEHRRADLPFRSGTRDELAELVDPGSLLFDPRINPGVGVFAVGAREELNAELLKVSSEARREQPLPLI